MVFRVGDAERRVDDGATKLGAFVRRHEACMECQSSRTTSGPVRKSVPGSNLKERVDSTTVL